MTERGGDGTTKQRLECQKPPEGGRGKGTDCPLEPPEGSSPGKGSSDFCLPELYENRLVLFYATKSEATGNQYTHKSDSFPQELKCPYFSRQEKKQHFPLLINFSYGNGGFIIRFILQLPFYCYTSWMHSLAKEK